MSFFKVNKKDNVSTVEKCVIEADKFSEKDRNYNPVQNSYATLWQEYESVDSPIPLMNVMRRILEYYFIQLCSFESNTLSATVLDAIKKEQIENTENSSADNRKYYMAQVMLSYIHSSDAYNEGLHFVDESIDCEQYRNVFQSIFEIINQGQYYRHMDI